MKRLHNGSKPLNAESSTLSTPPDPLDAASEHLDRADKATELLDYSEDFEEPTGRHEVTVNLHNPPQPSQPQIGLK